MLAERMMKPSAGDIKLFHAVIKTQEMEGFLKKMEKNFDESMNELYNHLYFFRWLVIIVAFRNALYTTKT